MAGLFHPLLCSFCGFTALFPKGTVLLQLLFACLFQGVTLFCVFPVVDRQCLVLARQCRKKKSQAPKLKDLMKLQLGQQSIKHPPLIPEFKDFVFLEKPSDESHLKLLEQPHSLEETTTRPTGRQLCKYGVWHSPAEFLEKAQQARHPVDADNFLHEATSHRQGYQH